MAKQIINIGTGPNTGTADSVRAAFEKVNSNFTELYTSLGLTDTTLNLGAFEFAGSVLSTTDSSAITIDQATTVTSNLTVGGDILPQTANSGDLGSVDRPWRSLHVSNNTVFFGGVPLSIEAGSNTLKINNVPIAQTINFTDITNAPAVPVDISDLTDTQSLLGQGSANTGDWAFSGNVAYNGTNYDQGLYVAPGGEGVSYIYVPGNSESSTTPIRIGNTSSTGRVEVNVYNKNWQFDSDGDLTLPQGGDILDSNGTSVLGGGGGSNSPVQPYLELTNEPFIIQPVVLGTPVVVTALATGEGAFVDVVILPSEGPLLESITVIQPGAGYVVGQRYRIPYWQVGGDNDADNIEFEVATVGPGGALLTITNAIFQGTFTASNTPGTYSSVSIEYRPSVFDEVDTGLVLSSGQFGGLFNTEVESSYNYEVSPTGTLWNTEGWGTLVGFNTRTYTTFDSIWNGNLNDAELVMWDTVNNKYYKFDFSQWNDGNGSYIYTRTLITDPNYFKKTDGLTIQDAEVDVIIEDSGVGQLEITYLEQEQVWVDLRDQDAGLIVPETRPWNGLPSYQAYQLILEYTAPDLVIPPESFLVPAANAAKQAYELWQAALAEFGPALGIGITRGNNGGIYNIYRDEGWNQNVSPSGTVWNIDGWDDLTDIESRIYTNFYDAYQGNLGNRIPGSQAVMYVPELDKYYAIDWLGWTQGGNYGGFSYTRREIDLTKLNEGISFPDGTKLRSAEGVGRVKSTAPGDRRIEEVAGYKAVAVTGRVTTNYSGLTSQTTNGYELRVSRTPELDAVFVPINQGSVAATFTLSYDNITFRDVFLSSVQATEYWFYFQNDNGQTTPQTEGDTVYIRTITGGAPVTWWRSADLPSGSSNFRGAVIDYHAYTSESTIIGTIHIVDDDGEEHISHQEVQSGSTDGDNDDLWLVTQEGQIQYRRIDGESKTLKIHWTAKVFYGSELYD